LSFFDEADEPQPRQETRRARPGARSGRPPGGSGRPPGSQHQQEVQTRRLIAAGVVVVIVIAMALLIKNCQGSAATNSLKSYNASVYGLISKSTSNAQQALGNKGLESGSLNGTTTAQTLATAETEARSQVSQAQALQAPSQMASAQAALVTVMQLRQKGLLLIANNAPNAANKKLSRGAVYQISLGTSQLYTSDVIYKTIVTEGIADALNTAGVPAQAMNSAQVIPDLGWLNQTWIATKIGAQLSTSQANQNNDQPGLKHGDSLVSTSVAGETLTAGGSYSITAADALTWAIGVSDGGDTLENQVGCSIKIQDQSDTGTSVIPTIAQGGTATCTVKLLAKPEPGTYSVTATVDKVPGETNLTNNSATYIIDFT
jgi:hypothetical protein